MTRKDTTTNGAPDEKSESGEAKVTYKLWLDNRPVCYVDGEHRATPPDLVGARLFAVTEALTHAQALFELIAIVGEAAPERFSEEGFANTLEGVGRLGERIINSAYSDVGKAWRLLPS